MEDIYEIENVDSEDIMEEDLESLDIIMEDLSTVMFARKTTLVRRALESMWELFMKEDSVLVMNVVLRLYEGTFFIDMGAQFMGELAVLVMNVVLKLCEGALFIDMGEFVIKLVKFDNILVFWKMMLMRKMGKD